MKKNILFILLLIIILPLTVNAEVCDNNKIIIDSITIDSKSSNIKENNTATTSDNNINLDLDMREVGDNIKYKVTIKNDSTADYEINKLSLTTSSKYIDYSIENKDNNNIIKAKTTKDVYLNVQYKNEIPTSLFQNGIYNINESVKINISNEKKDGLLSMIRNPNTGSLGIVIILLIILICITIIIILIDSKKAKITMILLTLLIIPFTANALCKYELNIESKIFIMEPNSEPPVFSTDSWSTIVNMVKKGVTGYYNVGDTKEVDMGSLGTHTIRIANMSTPSSCSTTGFSQTACGFVLEFADIVTNYRMYESSYTNAGGWPATEMRTYVNSDIYNTLPTELKNGIIDTTVVSGHGPLDSDNFISTDKLYLLSTHEIIEDEEGESSLGLTSLDSAYNNTRQLDYYLAQGVTSSNFAGAKKDNGWYLRSTHLQLNFIIVRTDGSLTYVPSYIPNGVSPAFRIGN